MSLNNIDALAKIKIRARTNIFNLADIIRNYRVLLIGLPGAFTPVDTNVYIPKLVESLPILDRHLDYIFCVTWNDPFVTKAWVSNTGIPKNIKFISDWNGYLTKSVGMDLNLSEYYLGTRSKRYAAIYDSGSLLWSAEADSAYPNDILNAIKKFKHWQPSTAVVDPCSNFNIEKSPKSKFSASNFIPVHVPCCLPRLSVPVIDEENGDDGIDGVRVPTFKNRLGSPRNMILNTLASNNENGDDPSSYSTKNSDKENSEDVADIPPIQSLPGSRERHLKRTSSESSALSEIRLLNATGPEIPQLTMRGFIPSDDVMRDGYLELAIDEVLDELIMDDDNTTIDSGFDSPRFISPRSLQQDSITKL